MQKHKHNMYTKQPSHTVYFSLPSVVHTIGKRKRSGLPSIRTRPYKIKAELSQYQFIKYKPDALHWNRWLQNNNFKLIYGLYDATDTQSPRYIGETNAPLKRINQHIKESVVLNNPSHKCDWIRTNCNNDTQIILRPLLIVPFNKRLIYEKIVRCMLKQLQYPIFNGAKISQSVYKTLEENKIQLRYISPHLLELIYNKIDITSSVGEKLIESIKHS